MPLGLSRFVDEDVHLADARSKEPLAQIRVTRVRYIGGRPQVRLAFDAPDYIRIVRGEHYQQSIADALVDADAFSVPAVPGDDATPAYVRARDAGTSPAAARAANRIMALSGMVLVRQACDDHFDVAAFTAVLARIIDSEMPFAAIHKALAPVVAGGPRR